MPARRALWIVLLVLALGAASCPEDDDEANGGDTEPTGRQAVAEETTTTGELACLSEGGDVGDERVDPRGIPIPITDVEVTGTDPGCRERVTFTFEEPAEDSALGYTVGFREPPFRDISGAEVSVEGSSFLQVVLLNGTTVDLSSGEARETYAGPDEVVGEGAELITEVVLVSDFEGQSEWVVGLAADPRTTAFALDLSEGPLQLVVEVGRLG